VAEGAQWNTNPEAESTLQKMARGMSQEEAGAQWEMPDDTLGSPNKKGTPEKIEEDTPAYRGENERANKRDDPGDGSRRERTPTYQKQNEADGKGDVRGGLKA
jgi:hypothetical protein